jgi:hypothetical protein
MQLRSVTAAARRGIEKMISLTPMLVSIILLLHCTVQVPAARSVVTVTTVACTHTHAYNCGMHAHDHFSLRIVSELPSCALLAKLHPVSPCGLQLEIWLEACERGCGWAQEARRPDGAGSSWVVVLWRRGKGGCGGDGARLWRMRSRIAA